VDSVSTETIQWKGGMNRDALNESISGPGKREKTQKERIKNHNTKLVAQSKLHAKGMRKRR
jgi:hypothetical protein